MVGGIGFEPMTSSASGKRSSTELTTQRTKILHARGSLVNGGIDFFSNQRDVDCAAFFDMFSLFSAVFKIHRMIAAGTPPS